MFNKKKKKKIFIFFEAALALSICCFAARMIKAHASSTDSADSLPNKFISIFSETFSDNSSSDGSPSDNTTDVTPEATPEPTIPAALDGTVTESHTTSATTSAVSIEWTPVEDAEGYSLTLTYNNNTTTIETTENTYNITDLSPATVISYHLSFYKTILGQKVYSSPSAEFSTSSSVTKVTGLTLTDRTSPLEDNGQVTLSWDAMSNALYNVYYKQKNASDYTLAGTATTNSLVISQLKASENYDFYVQAYCLSPDNIGEASDVISVTTLPYTVYGFSADSETETQIDLSWDENTSGNYYKIYRSVNDGPAEFLLQTEQTSYSDTNLEPGTVCSYQISVVNTTTGLESTLTSVLRCASRPTAVTGAAIEKSTATTISFNWEQNTSATGYIIYRKKGAGSYVYLTSTTETSYTDTSLASGSNYRYKLLAYADTEQHPSLSYSNEIKTSTLPARLTVKGKAGYGKLRLSWTATTGASGYYIYQLKAGSYELIDTLEGKSNVSKVYESMTIGTSYKYKVTAYRNAFSQKFIGQNSVVTTVKPVKTKKTLTTPSYYSTKKALTSSYAWSKVPYVKKYANYKKCITIPGIRSTNVAGFESTKMCPQAITFAGKYLLITAYDTYSEEKSVIYVMNKYNRKLLTVIVLPNKTHGGGICYDGKTVWVTNGQKISGVAFTDINCAASKKLAYKEVEYTKTLATNYKCSFLTYYKKQIWTGNFEYTKNGTLRSYTILNPNSENTTLKERSSVTIPPAVQGITFATGGKLIVSRAYGYTNELDIYKPAKPGTTSMRLGKRLKKITMPALNEGIAINGAYLYVNFESGLPGSLALNHMDRILALKLKAILK